MSLSIKETLKMRDTKGKEYCGSEDRLANFKRAGEAIGIDPIKVLYVYMCKHWDSISSYVKGNREGLSEPIRGRIERFDYLCRVVEWVD